MKKVAFPPDYDFGSLGVVCRTVNKERGKRQRVLLFRRQIPQHLAIEMNGGGISSGSQRILRTAGDNDLIYDFRALRIFDRSRDSRRLLRKEPRRATENAKRDEK